MAEVCYTASMSSLFPNPPATGHSLPATRPADAVRAFLALRRSAGKRTLGPPGPSRDEIEALLTVAMRVPDHRRLAPWRFLVFSGSERMGFTQHAEQIHRQEQPDAGEKAFADTRTAFERAPVVIALVSSPDRDHKTPVWEQELSTGAVGYNLLLATNAAGWAGCWLTEWLCYSPGIAKLIGLSSHERLAGFFYIGTATLDPQERMRPDPDAKVTFWAG